MQIYFLSALEQIELPAQQYIPQPSDSGRGQAMNDSDCPEQSESVKDTDDAVVAFLLWLLRTYHPEQTTLIGIYERRQCPTLH